MATEAVGDCSVRVWQIENRLDGAERTMAKCSLIR